MPATAPAAVAAADANATAQSAPGSIPSSIPASAPNSSVPAASVPKDQPAAVSFTEPPKAVEKIIEVAGSGMGASQPYQMYASEASAVYSAMVQSGTYDSTGPAAGMSPDALAQVLNSQFGINAQVSTSPDGRPAVVNSATGHVLAVDTNGDGVLNGVDLDFRTALAQAGVDQYQPGTDPMGQAGQVVQQALKTANLFGVAA